MGCIPPRQLQFRFSVPMKRGTGSGSIMSREGFTMSLDGMDASCVRNECSIRFHSALSTSMYYEVMLDASFFVSEYGLPLAQAIHLVFGTGARSCNSRFMMDGLGDDGLCQCFSSDDSCMCHCGIADVSRVL